jgi:uncharacterized membrane protein
MHLYRFNYSFIDSCYTLHMITWVFFLVVGMNLLHRASKRAPLKWGRFEEGLPLLSGTGVLGRFAPLGWAGFRPQVQTGF